MSDPVAVPDAEMALIGAVLGGVTGAGTLDDLLDAVAPDDFWQPAHERIWAAIGRIHRAGGHPEPVSVRLAVDAGDQAALVRVIGEGAFVAEPSWHAERVATAAGMRRLAAAAATIAQLPRPDGNLDQVREQARTLLDAACQGRDVSRARTIADLLPETLDAAQSGTSPVLPTGWPDIDRNLGGLGPGRLVVFGARPGGGKSVAGTNLALQFAHHHRHAVLLCSLEMPEREVMNRLLAAHAGVSLTDLENSSVSESDWRRIAAKTNELEAMPIHIIDDAGLSVQGIRKAARDVQRHRDDLALVVVDYLQLVTPDADSRRRGGNRAEEVSAISRGLKLLARETGACVVAMAQVNREGAKSDDGPKLTDLREGGIENDADAVVLLHRPDLETPEVVATIAKNRHGPLGVSNLQLQGHYARLASTVWTPTRSLA